jgi:type II secretory ATPase GspE/PulE/Tfp pilus assembly ATPase PilB-like protein
LGKEELDKAQSYAKAHNISIEEYLLNEGLINKELLGQAIAESYGIPYADLEAVPPSREQVLKIPEDIAKKYHLVYFGSSADGQIIATDNPKQAGLKEIIDKKFAGKIILNYSHPEDIEAAFIYYRKPLDTRFAKIIEEEERVAPEIIEEIIEDAQAFGASDIHFEPQEKDVLIRFRVDGVLHEAGRIPSKFYGNILNRIKIQAHLRIDEHFSAQDGAIRFIDSDKIIDMRVSIVPTLTGEKIAIRLLSKYVKSFNLGNLGLSVADQKRIDEVSKKPFGMLLVCGPTGSGKTTTLYALLKTINSPDVNITTIEDPVEYRIAGTNQIQVSSQTNLSFASGLRSIVRQDPDIILVGEIRDNETAEISVNAALTGHLLLSTFHANDAATAIPRLLDMKVEPFLLSSTIEAIVSQRLVRQICKNCRHSVNISSEGIKKISPDLVKYFPKANTVVYSGKGCKSCNNTGYKGRIGIFEIIFMTAELKDLILKNPDTKQIWELARQQGSHSLFEDGLEKVEKGVTTLEELVRVAPPK